MRGARGGGEALRSIHCARANVPLAGIWGGGVQRSCEERVEFCRRVPRPVENGRKLWYNEFVCKPMDRDGGEPEDARIGQICESGRAVELRSFRAIE